MAVSKKKKAAFASLIARQKEERKNEPVDGRKHSPGNPKGGGSASSGEARPNAVGVVGGEGSDPVAGRDPRDTSPEHGDVGGRSGGAGSGQSDSDRTSHGEDTRSSSSSSSESGK